MLIYSNFDDLILIMLICSNFVDLIRIMIIYSNFVDLILIMIIYSNFDQGCVIAWFFGPHSAILELENFLILISG